MTRPLLVLRAALSVRLRLHLHTVLTVTKLSPSSRTIFLVPQGKSSSSMEYGDLGQDVLFWGDDWQALHLQRSLNLPFHRPLLLHRPQTVFGWRHGTSTRCDTNTSLSQKQSSLSSSIFSLSPSRGTVLRLTWRFVDLRRRATPCGLPTSQQP